MDPAPSQGWQAYLELRLRQLGERTRLLPQRRHGPLSVQRPFYPEGETCHVYLLHPPGGVVGGDRLELRVELEQGANALLTAPGAAKFYRSAGETAEVLQQFGVAQSASLEMMPLENIYFPGARVRLHSRIELDRGARLLWWEKHCFGRPSIGETFDSGRVDTGLSLQRAGRLIYHERQRMDARSIACASGLRGQPAMATMLACGPGLDEALVELLRARQPEEGVGALSLLDEDLLLVRWLGADISALDRWFVALWRLLRPALIGREACPPRIWNT